MLNMAEDLSLFDVASSKLSDAQKLTIEAHELLKEDLERVRQERAAFEEITKTLKEVHFGRSVKLSVGGKIYKTTLSTLRKDPNSMLSAMFSGRHDLKKDEEDGAYFIDRDGKLFGKHCRLSFDRWKHVLWGITVVSPTVFSPTSRVDSPTYSMSVRLRLKQLLCKTIYI